MNLLRDIKIPLLPDATEVTINDYIIVECAGIGTRLKAINIDFAQLLNVGLINVPVATTISLGIVRLADNRESIPMGSGGINAAVVVQSNDDRLKPVTVSGHGLVPQLPDDARQYFWGNGQWGPFDNISESELDNSLQNIINGVNIGFLEVYRSISMNTLYSSGANFTEGGFIMGFFNSNHNSQFELTVVVGGTNRQYARAPLGSQSSRVQICVPKPPNTSFRINSAGVPDSVTLYFAAFQ